MNQTIEHENCPDCGGKTKLYTTGQYQGIWECEDCGASENHYHEDLIEEIDDTHPYKVTLTCVACGVSKVELLHA